MRKTLLALVILLVLPTVAAAGELFGKITEGTASVGENATVRARCGDKSYPAVKTDKTGSYHLVVTETGKCTLILAYKQLTAALDIASYDDGVQYDLVVEVKDGKLSVRRK